MGEWITIRSKRRNSFQSYFRCKLSPLLDAFDLNVISFLSPPGHNEMPRNRVERRNGSGRKDSVGNSIWTIVMCEVLLSEDFKP